MPVLSGSLPPEVIRGLRGTLDYYVWRGLPVVRSWPRKPKMPRSSSSASAAADFADFARRVASTDPTIVTYLSTAPGSSSWTWRDALTSAIYGHAYP